MPTGETGLLTDSRVRDLVAAAIAAGLADHATRIQLLGSVNQEFVAMQLPNMANIGVQLLSDLRIMNRVERLADGEVPLRQWLDTAEFLSSTTEQGAVFRSALDEVSRRATNEPRPSDIAPAPVRKKEAVIHRDDTLPVEFLAAGGEAARSVARLLVTRYESGAPILKEDGDPKRDVGTGWVLSPTLLVTNHHVVAARGDYEPPPAADDFERQAAEIVALFDYDRENAAGKPATFEGVLAADEELDYAILRSAKALPAPPLRLAGESIVLGADAVLPVNIIQHPDGQPKRAAIRNNLVYAAGDGLLQYFTDTRGGSSGSPVFDDRWRVVALHIGAEAVENVSFQGRSTAWVNVGAQMAAILQDLETNAPAVYAEIQG